MPNVISPYDPVWYAQEALIALESELGVAARIHRGYDKNPQQLGSTIEIRRPGTFVIQDGDAASAQDVKPKLMQISLNQHKKVEFALTDKELTYTGQRIIDEHIRPAIYTIADYIDQTLLALFWKRTGYAQACTGVVADFTGVRRKMRDNRVPMRDTSRLHAVIGPGLEEAYLGLQAFSQFQGAGLEGQGLQASGDLVRKYGFNIMPSQNVQTGTSGSITATDVNIDGTVAAATDPSARTSTIVLQSTALSGTIPEGTIVQIAGHGTKRYVTTTTVVAAANAATLVIFPALEQEATDEAVVTLTVPGGLNQSMAFHRNFAALAMAPLSEAGSELFGGRMATVSNPDSAVALRSTLWYDPNSGGRVVVRFDCLFGLDVLDPALAVRMTHSL